MLAARGTEEKVARIRSSSRSARAISKCSRVAGSPSARCQNSCGSGDSKRQWELWAWSAALVALPTLCQGEVGRSKPSATYLSEDDLITPSLWAMWCWLGGHQHDVITLQKYQKG